MEFVTNKVNLSADVDPKAVTCSKIFLPFRPIVHGPSCCSLENPRN